MCFLHVSRKIHQVRMFEDKALAKMYLVGGREELAFPETLCMCQMLR